MAKIKMKKGNIFDSSCQVIVNPVNCLGYMGKGLALEFKYRFPKMFLEYKLKCEKNELFPGVLHLHKESSPWVLNFPTKMDWKYPSKLLFIEKGMQAFSNNFKEYEINSIAFPKLGTALGHLKWDDVEKLMFKYLKPLPDLEVEIYEFDSKSPDKLFLNLKNKIDFDSNLLLTDSYDAGFKAKLQKIKKDIEIGRISNMDDLISSRGIGEVTIQKVFNLAKDSKNRKINNQLNLF